MEEFKIHITAHLTNPNSITVDFLGLQTSQIKKLCTLHQFFMNTFLVAQHKNRLMLYIVMLHEFNSTCLGAIHSTFSLYPPPQKKFPPLVKTHFSHLVKSFSPSVPKQFSLKHQRYPVSVV